MSNPDCAACLAFNDEDWPCHHWVPLKPRIHKSAGGYWWLRTRGYTDSGRRRFKTFDAALAAALRWRPLRESAS